MPKKTAALSQPQPPDFCFVDQLSGEHPPSFASMKALYTQALQLLALQPWDLLNEKHVIVVRQPDNQGDGYCTIMGSSGQVFSLYVYLGAESYAWFRKIVAGHVIAPADFLANVHSVYVEYVPKNEMEPPDRALLAALGLTPGKGAVTPIFRALRPGYHPWFVTAEEADLLALCLRAVTAVCLEIRNTGAQKYWSQPGILPLLEKQADSWRVEPIKPAVPAELPLRPASLAPEELARLRRQDFPIGGVMELDYFTEMMSVGGKNERRACAGVALAVDAKSGFVFSPALTSPPQPGEALAQAISGAITAGRAFPVEIHLRSKRVRDCVAAVAETLNIPLRIVRRLPAFDEAREGLLDLMAR